MAKKKEVVEEVVVEVKTPKKVKRTVVTVADCQAMVEGLLLKSRGGGKVDRADLQTLLKSMSV